MLSFANNGERRILFALVISMALHVLVLTRFGTVQSTQMAARSSVLQASLAPVVETSSSSAASSSADPVNEREQLQSDTKNATSSVERKTKVATPALNTRPPSTTVAVENPQVSLDQTKKAAQPEYVPGIPLPGLAGRLKRVTLEFETFSGSSRKSLGSGSQLYVAGSDSNFSLSIKQQSKAGDSGQNDSEHLEITGRITPQGLSPVLFERSGAGAERLMALKDVSATRPQTGGSSQLKGRMPDGILDRQSLLYQFMLKAPDLGGGRLWLSDGVNNGLYSYRLAGFETFRLPSFGEVRTIKLILTGSDSSDSTELWLIPDLHYLPVKMRHTDTKGEVIEQVVTTLDFN